MGFGAPKKEDSAMKEFANLDVKQVRDVLAGLLLPPEVIDQALQKLAEFGDDIDRVADYAISLPNPLVPQVECIEAHLSDDMVSSDEEVEAARAVEEVEVGRAVKEEEQLWKDPICKLFQEPDVPEGHPPGEGGGSVAAGDAAAMGAAAAAGYPVQVVASCGEASCSYQLSPEVKTEPATPPTSPTRLPAAPTPAQRQASFLDMGFSFDLVDRAFKQHAADVEDSALLQYLIDNSALAQRGSQMNQVDNDDGDDAPPARVVSNVPERLNTCLHSSDSDSDSEFLAMTPCNGRGANEGSAPHSDLRTAMYQLGFAYDLVETAIEELGEAVQRERFVEYLLSIAERKRALEDEAAPRYPSPISTLEKLTTEFQFPVAAVEIAMSRCETPMWNATQNDIILVVDFLAAHMEALLEDEAITLPDSDDSDDDESYDLDFEEGFSDEVRFRDGPSWGPKRKPESSLMARGKSPMPRGRPRGSPNGVKKTPANDCRLPKENKNKGATGFGLPGMPLQSRHLKDDVKGAPFFYFENVASMPQGAWARIKNHLFDIEPEFVDAMYFSACRRSRGYIHNLPIEGRKKMIQDPPMTIKELLPQTTPFWPEWDKRTKLNCISTVRGSGYCARKQGVSDGSIMMEQDLTDQEKKAKVSLCSKWNLVWTSPNFATPVEANEIEMMLGFDRDHSRPCLSNTAKYKALGNSFSVYVVAYHFSVLRPLYPKGIKVLSLFSGIGGAEVALHKVGIKLSVVVSVEIDAEPRRIMQSWWKSSRQTGVLDIDYHDVRDLTREVLTRLVCKYRGFDLIVGGSPCNNFTGNNRVTRTGLEGDLSSMFFEFSRIVATVRELTIKLQRGW